MNVNSLSDITLEDVPGGTDVSECWMGVSVRKYRAIESKAQ